MHDRYGVPLAIGDMVGITGIISSMQSPDTPNDYCNVTILTDVPMAGSPYYVTLNAKQTEKIGAPEEASAPEDPLPWEENTAP